MFSYRNLCVGVAALTLTLCVLLFGAPQYVALLFGIESNAVAEFLARRTALLFLGYAILAVGFRNVEPSPIRQTFLLTVAVLMGGLAVLGAIEFARDFAGPGILGAVAGESAFAVWALMVRRRRGESQPLS